VVPLAISVVARAANLNGIASATVPKHEQALAGVIKVEIEIVGGEGGIRFE
jgi:hypothetical protein